MKKSRSDKVFDFCNIALTIIITFIIVYPLYFIVIASFSDPYAVATGQVVFLPNNIMFDAYLNVFRRSEIWTGYRNSIFYTVAGTAYNLVLTIPAAYVLSKKYLPMQTGLTWFYFITMYFGGGLIPSYILMKSLGLINNPLALVVGTGVNCWNLIVTRQFFQSSIPDELYQSARIDGASELRAFISIALPLSAPILAVMALFYGVGQWNSYYSALIYITDHKLFPLQLVLRNILILNQTALNDIVSYGSDDTEALQQAIRLAYMANAMKYAIIFIASAPLLAVYPFVQKYFVKGVMIGSLKG